MEWINVKDSLPRRMLPVIVCRKDGEVEVGYIDNGHVWKLYGGYWWRARASRSKNVTHWMLLPEPPKED